MLRHRREPLHGPVLRGGRPSARLGSADRRGRGLPAVVAAAPPAAAGAVREGHGRRGHSGAASTPDAARDRQLLRAGHRGGRRGLDRPGGGSPGDRRAVRRADRGRPRAGPGAAADHGGLRGGGGSGRGLPRAPGRGGLRPGDPAGLLHPGLRGAGPGHLRPGHDRRPADRLPAALLPGRGPGGDLAGAAGGRGGGAGADPARAGLPPRRRTGGGPPPDRVAPAGGSAGGLPAHRGGLPGPAAGPGQRPGRGPVGLRRRLPRHGRPAAGGQGRADPGHPGRRGGGRHPDPRILPGCCGRGAAGGPGGVGCARNGSDPVGPAGSRGLPRGVHERPADRDPADHRLHRPAGLRVPAHRPRRGGVLRLRSPGDGPGRDRDGGGPPPLLWAA